MNLLFIHQNFPGQYKNLSVHLVSAGHRVVAVREAGVDLPGIESVVYRPYSDGPRSGDRYTAIVEPALRRAHAVRTSLTMLREQGFQPDIVLGHSGWGELLYVKDIWPEVPFVGFIETFARIGVSESAFDPSLVAAPDLPEVIRTTNIATLMTLDAIDVGVTPTEWQKSQIPSLWHDRMKVIHDGIDTDRVAPHPSRRLRLPSGLELGPEDEVVTYVSRALEPHRGFPTFIAAVAEIQRRRPRAQILVVGREGQAYSPPPPGQESYKSLYVRALGEGIDHARLHFIEPLPYYQLLAVLQISKVHVYLTYPSILSWSMLEAMSAGCLVVGSATPPVMEVIENGRNGLLVDFFDVVGLVDCVAKALADPAATLSLREAARRTVVERYDFARVCLPRHMALIEAMVPRC